MEERETAADSQGESLFAEMQSPRLSILHLMLWTLCSAVYLSLLRAIYSLQGDMPGGYGAIRDTTSVIQGIVTGAVLAGGIVLASTRVRCGPPMLRQPGHWFLFVSTVFHLIYIPSIAVFMLLQRSASFVVGFFWLYSIIFVFPIIAYGIASRSKCALRWKLIFFGLAAVNLAQCALYLGIWLSDGRFGSWFLFLSTIPSFGSLLIVGAVVVVSIVDLVAREPRDWLHWTGVVTHVAASSVTVLWMIAARFTNLS